MVGREREEEVVIYAIDFGGLRTGGSDVMFYVVHSRCAGGWNGDLDYGCLDVRH